MIGRISMAFITRNDYGAVAVNTRVISKIVVNNLLDMSDYFVLCNKKGKLIKKNPTPFIDPDYYDAVEITDNNKEFSIRIYLIPKLGKSISVMTDTLIEKIEDDFNLINLRKPDKITISIKGVLSRTITKRDIEVTRSNE